LCITHSCTSPSRCLSPLCPSAFPSISFSQRYVGFSDVSASHLGFSNKHREQGRLSGKPYFCPLSILHPSAISYESPFPQRPQDTMTWGNRKMRFPTSRLVILNDNLSFCSHRQRKQVSVSGKPYFCILSILHPSAISYKSPFPQLWIL
jgi:hypothetical protein